MRTLPNLISLAIALTGITVLHLAHARACFGILLDALATGKLIDDRRPAGVSTELVELLTANVEQR